MRSASSLISRACLSRARLSLSEDASSGFRLLGEIPTRAIPFPRATKEIGDVCTQANKPETEQFVFVLFDACCMVFKGQDGPVVIINTD